MSRADVYFMTVKSRRERHGAWLGGTFMCLAEEIEPRQKFASKFANVHGKIEPVLRRNIWFCSTETCIFLLVIRGRRLQLRHLVRVALQPMTTKFRSIKVVSCLARINVD